MKNLDSTNQSNCKDKSSEQNWKNWSSLICFLSLIIAIINTVTGTAHNKHSCSRSAFLYNNRLTSDHSLDSDMVFFFSPFLDAGKREALADYALVAAVLIMSLFASYFVRDINSKYLN